MPRTAILTGIKAGKPEVIHLQDTPLADQVKRYNALATGEEPSAFDSVELWTSAGGAQRKDVKPPAPVADKKSRKPGKE